MRFWAPVAGTRGPNGNRNCHFSKVGLKAQKLVAKLIEPMTVSMTGGEGKTSPEEPKDVRCAVKKARHRDLPN